MLNLEQLPDRTVPAILSLGGAGALTFADDGTENNTVTVGTANGVYSINDSATVITLAQSTIDAGWKGGGTHTVSGPASVVDGIEIDAGGGTNVVNLKSLIDPTTVNGDSGTTQVNINSVAPVYIGGLAGIQADVTINAGDATSLMVSDYSGVSRPNPIVISATGITGLGSHDFHLSGTFDNLKVVGSNSSTLAETYTVDAPDAVNFYLLTEGGADDVTVTAWGTAFGTFDGGNGGADSLTILDGVNVSGTAANFETNNYNLTGYGTLS